MPRNKMDPLFKKGGHHAPEFRGTDPKGVSLLRNYGAITFEKVILNQNSAIFLL